MEEVRVPPGNGAVLQPDGAPQLVLDDRGRVVDANPAACDLLAIAHPDLLHKPFVLFLDAACRAGYLRLLREGRRGTPGAVAEIELLPRDGTLVTAHLALSPVARPAGHAVVFLWPDPRRADLDAETRRLVELERRHREVGAALDEALRPRPLDLEGVELGTESSSADPGSRLGGDLCDWLVLPDGALHLCVVDSEGRGMLATRVGLNVRSTIRSLALTGCPMDDLLARAEVLTEQQEPGAGASVTVARFDPRTHRLEISRAGQPPPLLLRAGGGIEPIGSGSRPLGYGRGRPRTVDRLRFAPDELLVLYTDGLIEGRDTPAEGVADLGRAIVELAEGRDLSAAGIAEQLLARSGAGTDDALVAVLRHRPATGVFVGDVEAPEFHAELTQMARHHLQDMRQHLTRWLAHRHVGHVAARDTLLVVTELAANAMQAARDRSEVHVGIVDGQICIEVVDDGPGLRPRDVEAGGQRGYGLRIIESIGHNLQVVPSLSGTVVRCRVPAGT